MDPSVFTRSYDFSLDLDTNPYHILRPKIVQHGPKRPLYNKLWATVQTSIL